jgi:hypothetical protein
MGHTENIFKNYIDYEDLKKIILKSSMYSIPYNHVPSNPLHRPPTPL